MISLTKCKEGILWSCNDDRIRPFLEWLESDVQWSKIYSEKIEKKMIDISSGVIDSWENTGNQFTLHLTALGARVISDDPYLDSPIESSEISPGELVCLLVTMRNVLLLKNGQSLYIDEKAEFGMKRVNYADEGGATTTEPY
jgi:hypothetical protein